jgi:hypothetical protein
MNSLPKFVTKRLAAHDFNQSAVVHIFRYGQHVKPREFTAVPFQIYMNGPDMFGERHIKVEEHDLMTCELIANWTVIVGNGQCYQI